jgi:ribosomal RNA assembly protein
MDEFSYTLKIPKERVAVLIGKKGETKKELEELTETDIDVDSKEGEVTISGGDPIKLYTMREVIKAIARGFNPDVAKNLMKQDFVYEQISIKDFAKTQNHMLRLKGRVIGTEGKSRRMIEELSEADISVYGKTIGILGRAENVDVARRAVHALLTGSPHSNVYKWLEKKRREIKRAEFDASNTPVG